RSSARRTVVGRRRGRDYHSRPSAGIVSFGLTDGHRGEAGPTFKLFVPAPPSSRRLTVRCPSFEADHAGLARIFAPNWPCRAERHVIDPVAFVFLSLARVPEGKRGPDRQRQRDD